LRLKNKLNLINSLQPEKGSILDIGAGQEILSVAKKNGWHTIGVEPSEKQSDCKKGVSFVEETSEFIL
jgi:hypothetical protein